jgi:hypothetical protein
MFFKVFTNTYMEKHSAVTLSVFLDGVSRKVLLTGLLLIAGIPIGVIMVTSNSFVEKIIVALKVRSQLVYRKSEFFRNNA